MKKCPTCGKTFEDNLKFCQSDGTPLVQENPPDPYQTVVVKPEDIGDQPVPLEPITPSTKAENTEDVLEIPEDDDDEADSAPPAPVDPMKTAVVSDAERREIFADLDAQDSSSSETGDAEKTMFVSDSERAELGIPSDAGADAPPPPKFNEPDLPPPNFGDIEGADFGKKHDPGFEEKSAPPISPPIAPPPVEPPKPKTDLSEQRGSSSVPPSAPIPSPFDASMPPGYQAPDSPPFNKPEEKPRAAKSDAPPPSPFGSSPFDQPKPANQQMQSPQGAPPPAPRQQNQQFNPPSSPPARGGQGENKTLAIVSLVLGILGFVCLGFLGGIGAIITGFIARKKAKENPSEYGGEGIALAGIIIGALSTILSIGFLIIYFVLLGMNAVNF